jgi:hypothetical protein
MDPMVRQQIEDSLQQLWLDDLRLQITGFGGGKDSTPVANEYVVRN